MWKRLYEKVLSIFEGTRKKCIWFWKEKMLPLTKEQLKSYEDAKECYIWENFSKKILLKIKITVELENIAIVEVNTEAWHTVFVI